MRKIHDMIHTALRDDSTATVGLQALLGHTTTPYGVYHFHLPEKPDFSAGTKSYLTHYEESCLVESDTQTNGMIRRKSMYMITAWGSMDKVLSILRRAKYILHNLHSVTLPTSDCEVYGCQLDWEGPDLYDEILNIYYKTQRFKIWYRDDAIYGT